MENETFSAWRTFSKHHVLLYYLFLSILDDPKPFAIYFNLFCILDEAQQFIFLEV